MLLLFPERMQRSVLWFAAVFIPPLSAFTGLSVVVGRLAVKCRSSLDFCRRLEEISRSSYASILYESPHRIVSTMNELKGYLEEDRRVCICRELTKAYESIEHTTIGGVNGEKLVLKGEYTLVVEGKREYSDRHPKPASVVDEKAMKCMDVLRAEGVSRRVIQRVMKEVFDVGMVSDLDLAVGICGKEGLVSIIVCFFALLFVCLLSPNT